MASNNVLILKELEQGFNTGKPLSGIVRLESDSGVSELSLSLINISPVTGGELYLYIFGKNSEIYTFPLSPRPSSLRKSLAELGGVDGGFASALVLIKGDIPLTLAFGKTEGFYLTLNGAKKLIAEKCLLDRKNERKKQEFSPPAQNKPCPSAPAQEEPCSPSQAPQKEPYSPEKIQAPPPAEKLYNDEAVATENYYELDEELKSKLEKINVKENEKLSNADGDATNPSQKEKETGASRADFLSDEENLFAGESQSQRREPQKPFYITAERELKTLFEKFPPYDNLKCYFPDSRWVKIPYSQDRFYIVGTICENKEQKYICYGVPEKYSATPPKELKGYCTFIPLSIFDMQGEGFWMMFQDAVSGECVLPGKGE